MALKKVGGAWRKENPKGKYFSLSIELADGSKQNFLMYPNDRKEQEKHPDYNIMKIVEDGPKEG